MSQIDLFAPPTPRVTPPRPVAVTRPEVLPHATRLLWLGAGRPLVEGVATVGACPCWWCAGPLPDALGAPTSILPDTFGDAPLARAPASRWLCAACAWTISDHVSLPAEVARAALEKRLTDGGRVEVTYGEHLEPQKVIGLRLDGGMIGLWTRASPTALEAPWTAAIPSLRGNPRDVGPCSFLGAFFADDIGTGTARFRNYHHIATRTRWLPISGTAEGKDRLRSWLLAPPPEPWVCVIGDGQKHGALMAEVADPSPVVCRDRVVIRYEPDDLAAWLAAYEGLVVAGASEEEIADGVYTRGTVELHRAARRWDPILAPIRGARQMDLVAAESRELDEGAGMNAITPEEWRWLRDHPLWSRHGGCWDACVVLIPMFVDPATGEVHDDPARNTRLDVWIEAGPMWIGTIDDAPATYPSHDPDLDCGGETLGEALAALGRLVRRHYGDGDIPLATDFATAKRRMEGVDMDHPHVVRYREANNG